MLPIAEVVTPVRLLVVDSDAANLTSVTSLAEEEGVDVRTAVDADGAVEQCRLEYLDVVMIDAGAGGPSAAHVLQAIRTLRPTVRTVMMNGAHVQRQLRLRQLLRQLRSEPRHVPCGFIEVLGAGADITALHFGGVRAQVSPAS